MNKRKTPLSTIILLVVITIAVVIGGVYWWQSNQSLKSPIPTEIPVITEQNDSAKVTPELEQNVKTYTNSQFQYSFQYPKNWVLTKGTSIEVQPEVVLISKQELKEDAEPDTEISITINKSTLEDNIRENLVSREKVTFAGKPATKIKFTGDFGGQLISILIQQNDYTFVISYDPTDIDYSGIETILNSFSFTR